MLKLLVKLLRCSPAEFFQAMLKHLAPGDVATLQDFLAKERSGDENGATESRLGA